MVDKTKGLIDVMFDVITSYAKDHGISNSEIVNAMAHLYVGYAFTVKAGDTSNELLKETLVDCVSKMADHTIKALGHEKA